MLGEDEPERHIVIPEKDLKELCKALSWKVGSFKEVLNEIKRLKKLDRWWIPLAKKLKGEAKSEETK